MYAIRSYYDGLDAIQDTRKDFQTMTRMDRPDVAQILRHADTDVWIVAAVDALKPSTTRRSDG